LHQIGRLLLARQSSSNEIALCNSRVQKYCNLKAKH
jgi:hypothetical protein